MALEQTPRERPFIDPLEQLVYVGTPIAELRDAFEEVVHSLRVATLDMGGLTEAQREEMITSPSFWDYHFKLMVQLEAQTPGIRTEIFQHAERIQQAQIDERNAHVERVASKLGRRAFWRGLIGLPVSQEGA